MDKGQLKDLIFILFITALLFLFANLFGSYSQIISFFAVIPLIFIVIKYGIYTGLISVLLIMLAFFIFVGIAESIIFLLIYGSVGISMGYMISKGFSAGKNIAICSIILITASFISIIFSSVYEENILMSFYGQLEQEKNQIIALYDKKSGNNASIKDLVSKFIYFLKETFAGWLVITTSINVFLYYVLSRKIMPRLGYIKKIPQLSEFGIWKVPYQWIWVFLISGIMLFLSYNYIKSDDFRRIGANLLLISIFPYIVIGFSVIHHFFKKKLVNLFARTAGYLIVVIFPLMLAAVITVGLFDTWFNFRKI